MMHTFSRLLVFFVCHGNTINKERVIGLTKALPIHHQIITGLPAEWFSL
ncbi:hypothetical protein TERTU_3415 [Teredinibacter turnerae T7901]|uniref:Uncharacterized protein n=1 Tax=Teredinibacter turnerae (strain ATCC 39867 / T7901) TaxID=377629 RepID=C5BQR8_TERTT|nr:hypothetical protein TERTU_3415 [Teredinibacter turnerae T7901]